MKSDFEEKIVENWLDSILKLDTSLNLGIPDNGFIYHFVNDDQSRSNEFLKTEDFFCWLISNNPNFFDPKAQINFINYGDTELVYVIDDNGYKRTLLVGQPNTEFGVVRREYENLKKLAQQNPELVVCPITYFSHDSKESYLTPYLYQARCIASYDNSYGSYIPEPTYHFSEYSSEDAYIICKAMVANLLILYNHEEHLGLASCKIGGGDFILEKEYDYEIHNIENTLKRMHLTAARKLISIDFNTYVDLIRNEFKQITYYKNEIERDSNILINCKNRVSMSLDSIEDGIQLGLKLTR